MDLPEDVEVTPERDPVSDELEVHVESQGKETVLFFEKLDLIEAEKYTGVETEHDLDTVEGVHATRRAIQIAQYWMANKVDPIILMNPSQLLTHPEEVEE